MRIGVLGSGSVGKTLGAGFLKHGHEVMLGTREAGKLADWSRQNVSGRVGSFSQAAQFGEMLVLAVKGPAAAEAVRAAGVANIQGKCVMDATNPIADAPPVNGVVQFYTSLAESQMERLQREFPAARFVKAFNSVGVSSMVNPKFAGGPPTMFICGNDDAAKKTVAGIAQQLGWEVEDLGKVEAARAIEPLCMLWLIPSLLHNDWAHAFKMLR